MYSLFPLYWCASMIALPSNFPGINTVSRLMSLTLIFNLWEPFILSSPLLLELFILVMLSFTRKPINQSGIALFATSTTTSCFISLLSAGGERIRAPVIKPEAALKAVFFINGCYYSYLKGFYKLIIDFTTLDSGHCTNILSLVLTEF